jgi:hypothetical protein
LAEFTPPFVVGLRDAVATGKKRWMANYAVKVLRLAFSWGRIHGWCVTIRRKGCHSSPGQPARPNATDHGQRRSSPWSKAGPLCD